jgi:hypothetical protein
MAELRFQSYCRLKQYLGQYDAIVELTELAMRELLENAILSENVSAYISKSSDKFKIKVSYDSNLNIAKVLSEGYIVNVCQSAELFLHEFSNEYSILHKVQWKSYDKKSKLQGALENVTNGASININEQLSIELFEYYKLVRNSIVHKSMTTNKICQLQKDILSKHSQHIISQYQTLPNDPQKLNFDDFILFSRVTKDIAGVLCRLGKPSDAQIMNYVLQNAKQLKKFANNPTRFKDSIMRYLKFALNLDEKEINYLIDEIIRRMTH